MPSFQSKARTIDHLGKSQIADMPTAILELWKNGYDAYGNNMSCELYIPGSLDSIDKYLMTVSDDGIGMSVEDIKDVWLTIGTDSKIRGVEKLSREERLGKDERIKMGEKGIGRLSVAYLGSPMLLITKKINEPPVMLLTDWRIFTNYNLYLSDIDMPIVEGYNINENINILSRDFLKNVDTGDWTEHKDLLFDIKESIKSIKLDKKLSDKIDEKFQLSTSHGTIFIILEFDSEQIGISSETKFTSDNFNEDNESTSEWRRELRSSLSGMINPFQKKLMDINTSFLVHLDKNTNYDLIAKGAFFDYKDIDHCEHSIQGRFDENGLFNGSIKVYGESFPYTFRPNRIPGKTSYGAFDLSLGHIEGEFSSSKMNEELYRVLSKKMEAFGGLYIYKNNFRILPYGRQEYDFLKFEERRSKRAGTYVLSHRKMIGYIGLTGDNKGFREKSGREGFIDNKTYKEFRQDLIAFFVDVAKRFYASSSKKDLDDHFKTYRQLEIEKIKKDQKDIDRKEKKKERKTKTGMKDLIEENTPLLDDILIQMIDMEKRMGVLNNNISISMDEYEVLEDEYTDLKKRYSALKLMGYSRFKFNDKEKRSFNEYKKREYAIAKKIDSITLRSNHLRSKFEIKELDYLLGKALNEKRKEYSKLLSVFKQKFHKSINKLESHYNNKEHYFEELMTESISTLRMDKLQTSENYMKTISRLEENHISIVEKTINTFSPFIGHIENLDTEIDEDKLTGFYKNQYEDLKEKAESMYELSQLGMAVEIIDHQFNVLYSSVSSSIKKLDENIPNNKIAKENLETLRHSIEHLENNHRLLTPLYRSNRRVKREISGEALVKYLHDFFGDQLLIGNNSILEVNEEFLQYTFYTFPSVLQPVFINIINNALYWLNSTIPNERKIIIGKYDNEVIIENSGKPIDDFDLENVFKLFFSRRPAGRGIGLNLAKTNLNTIGMDIYATNKHKYKQLCGGCFVIKLEEKR